MDVSGVLIVAAVVAGGVVVIFLGAALAAKSSVGSALPHLTAADWRDAPEHDDDPAYNDKEHVLEQDPPAEGR
ncbi:MAG: hypothetical protein ACRDXX_02780 [Stackebrandtia sp.]